MRLATDLHGGLVQRQPPPRRFHIYRFRLGSSPHTPAPEPTTELCIPAPVHRSHPLSFIGPETGKSQLSRPAAYAQRTGKTTFADLRSVRLRGKGSRLWCRRQDSNLRLSELALYATIRPSSTAEVRLHEGGCRSFPAVTAACRLLAVSPDRYTFLLPSCALSPEARSSLYFAGALDLVQTVGLEPTASTLRGALTD